MAALTIQQAFELAAGQHRAGNLSEAESVCRQIIAQQGGHADTLHLLGIVCQQLGRPGEAESFLRRAVDRAPAHPGYWANLGSILAAQGRTAEAIDALRRSVALRPNHVQTRIHLANALLAQSQLDQALAEAQEAVALKEDFAEAQVTLGNVLLARGLPDAAADAYRSAIAIQPSSATALNALGLAMRRKLALPEAIAALRLAVEAEPNHVEALNNLGICLAETRNYDESIAVYRRAAAARPDSAEVWANLAGALQDTGQLDEAIALFRRAQSIRPNHQTGDTLLLSLHYHPQTDPAGLAAEHRQWARTFAAPLARFVRPHANDRTPDRRLRIGYVSADFRDHPVGGCFLPVVSRHDRAAVEVFCYSVSDEPDPITGRIRASADTFRDVASLSEEQLAESIHEDRIDILVDLGSHTRENRLLTFARKPAPVQVSWLGWPGTTGLETIDYRLSDPYLDPTEPGESIYAERTVRLPDCFWCYDPTVHEPVVDVNELPALRNGYVTFASISIFTKINAPLLDLWASIMAGVERSRLRLRAPPGQARQRLLDRFARQGVDPSRIGFVERVPRDQYGRLFHEIDITLDTFPYNGHTSSLDSLWMGVPIVTQPGRLPVSRAGLSILSNLRLTELVAQSAQDYVRIATHLAHDLPRLAALRSSLRQRLQTSPIMDASRFAQNLEATYQRMWIQWVSR
jgi:predicted O-linked N-acetylglucosamine transferase (SPINDLY family)